MYWCLLTLKLESIGVPMMDVPFTGLVEVCLMHPLDLIKTRLQVGQHDKGMLDCVTKTFRSEGFLGFYKVCSVTIFFSATSLAAFGLRPSVCFQRRDHFASLQRGIDTRIRNPSISTLLASQRYRRHS